MQAYPLYESGVKGLVIMFPGYIEQYDKLKKWLKSL